MADHDDAEGMPEFFEPNQWCVGSANRHLGPLPPILPRLLTSLGDATEVAHLYRPRWRIEQIFRALESDRRRLDDGKMHDVGKLFKLAAVGSIAAARTQHRRNQDPAKLLHLKKIISN